MIDLISPLMLIAIGIGLIALEALLFSFVLFWFGVATIIVGVLSYLHIFGDGLWQLSSIAILSMILLFFLRSKVLQLFLKSKDGEHDDNFFNEEGVGVIRNGSLYYKATYWNIDPMNKEKFEDGEQVHVLSINKGIATIEKLKRSTSERENT